MKTYDLPITHNPLITRDDLAQSMKQILAPCEDALVLNGSGLFVGNTSAHYSARGTLLEGWSRLLWGLSPLRAGGFSWSGQDKHFKGLIAGTNPEDKNYWGDVKSFDQRMVEMAAIALSLLIAPEFYWDPLNQKEKDNLVTWLNMINTHDMSHNNWLFFRVLVNIALEKHSREEFNPTLMESDLVELEEMYAEDGWYHDKLPFDNYNPFAMQYYSLIYYKFKKDADVERCERFKKRVNLFAKQHIYYLTNEGPFVPFGRSLTYRFAVVSFYSACAFAGIEVLPWGVLKGIVLRNIRWWFKKPIFDRDGFLTIGFVNPSLIIGEQYNAPGSPYWSLKTYIILALKEDHPFWTSKELPLPELEKTKLLNVPNIIMQRTKDDDVVMLNGGQYPEYHMMHIAEKYAKFAYSAHYGFSASSSYYDFEKCGCDSMLYFSEDGETFRPRREMKILTKNEDYVSSLWKPYPDVEVITYLIPVDDYHVRVHKIKCDRSVVTREGGFAIELHRGMEFESNPEIIKEIDSSICIKMPWDVSIISDLKQDREAVSVCPTPNLNCMATTTIVPVLEGAIRKGESKTYVSLVGASRNTSTYFKNKPSVRWKEDTSTLILKDKSIILK